MVEIDKIGAAVRKGNQELLDEYLKERMKDLAQHSEIIGDVRGKGLFTGIEFVKNKQTKESFSRSANVVKKIVRKGMSAGYTPIAATVISDKIMEPFFNGSKQIFCRPNHPTSQYHPCLRGHKRLDLPSRRV